MLSVVVLAFSTVSLASAGPVGVSFQPYIGDWSGNPPSPPLFNSYTYADVLADLQKVKEHFTTIKTYGIGTSYYSDKPGGTLDSNQYNVPAAAALGMKVHLGAALQFDGTVLNVDRTHLEIDRAIQQAKDHPGTVLSIIVGNETIGTNGVTVQNMVDFMNYAKTARNNAGFSAANLPITTAERWGVLAGAEHKALSETAEGKIFANIYPFFDANTPIENAITQFEADFSSLRNSLNGFGLSGLQIIVGETGWATAGTNTANALGIPSVANAQKYYNDYVAWAVAHNVETYYFAAFDEPWKASPTTEPQSVEPHFGLRYSNGTPKFNLAGAGTAIPEANSLLLLAIAAGAVVTRRVTRRR
ncbi:MAG: glycosyl hydrolase family 17 protein [Planctomycetota bacterium]